MGKRGSFLSLEGIDGSGKTTQIPYLVEFLKKTGKAVVQLREPGGTTIGEDIRAILLNKKNTMMSVKTELLLFAAARAQLVEEVIAPALERGDWVVCDRFMDSTVAYQGYGRQLDLGLIKQLNQIAVDKYIPDLTLIFDLPVETALARLTHRTLQQDRLDLENKAFMERTRLGYIALAKSEPDRFSLINAANSEKDIQKQIRNILREGTSL